MKKYILSFLCILVFTANIFAQTYSLVSPGNINEVKISIADKITLSVFHLGQQITDKSPASITIDGKTLGTNAKVVDTKTREVIEKIHPVVSVKRAVIADHFRELEIFFKGNFALLLRCYDDGVAYRFRTTLPGEIIVNEEEVQFNFMQDFVGEFPFEDSFYSHSERKHLSRTISQIKPGQLSSLPAMVSLSDGKRAVITEADLLDYPGLYLTGSGQAGQIKTTFPRFVLQEEKTSDRDVRPMVRADFLAKTKGTRSFPWRLMVISDEDRELLENELVYQLSSPSRLTDTDWIKPGKIAWDWYNDNNIYGVDFQAGINTDTYKYFIDFASTYGLQYIILDEGWYDIKTSDLLHSTPQMDVEEIINYGKSKNVGVILWVTWKALEDQMDPALDQFVKWGAKGIKVDFMQRDDQWMVNYYQRVAEAAAKRKLLVDFHGSYKPAGLQRTYPNVLTREGVRGLEWSKWSSDANPDHNLRIPFLRMLAGGMDYTPGAMRNAQLADFDSIHVRPMALGTRCHQLAMYVVFESPLQMLADSPSNYLKNTECMEFLGPVPSVWDETIVLDASYGNYIVTARRSGNDWYLGAMTSWEPRELTVDLKFLPAGVFDALVFQDGRNANRMAEDYKKVQQQVTSGDLLTIQLAPGGGWAARLVPVK